MASEYPFISVSTRFLRQKEGLGVEGGATNWSHVLGSQREDAWQTKLLAILAGFIWSVSTGPSFNSMDHDCNSRPERTGAETPREPVEMMIDDAVSKIDAQIQLAVDEMRGK